MLPPPFPPYIEQLPSPESLKYQVLLKGTIIVDENDKFDEDEFAQYQQQPSYQKNPYSSGGEKKKQKKTPTPPELLNLIHFKTIPFDNRDHSRPWEMCSFSESKLESISKNYYKELANFTRQRFVRVYPMGLRVDSSNYDPIPSWNCGAQMVALNYQTIGSPSIWLNDAKFLDNGMCGYLVKPERMRLDPNFSIHAPVSSFHGFLEIDIISGWKFPRINKVVGSDPEINPYIRIDLCGIPKDTRTWKSKVVYNNAFNPEFNQKAVFVINMAELDFVLFQLRYAGTKDKSIRNTVKQGLKHLSSAKTIGYYVLPVHWIKTGFRTIVFNCPVKGSPLCSGQASLLLKLEFTN